MKIDLHVHTSELSLCGKLTIEETISLYRKTDYDAIVVADHFTADTGEVYLSRGIRDYAEYYFECRQLAVELGRKHGFLVLPGCELRFKENINDYKIEIEYGYYSPTVASVSIGASAEILAKLPQSAKIYLDFDINEQQPEAAWDKNYQKKMLYKENGASSVINAKVTTLTDADKPVKKAPIATQNDGRFPIWAVIAIAGGAVVIVAVVVVVIILLKKKKK